MIIGCLGKGGSGKSTIATLLVKALQEKNNSVLAIDADHNMDLSYNLGFNDERVNYIGTSLPKLLEYAGLEKGEKYYEVFHQGLHPVFSFGENMDPYTEEFSTKMNGSLQLMIAGPHTDKILHGEYCSHSLGTPLKIYLPFLNLEENEFVIIDEKAGSDGAGTGICTGFDVACIMAEPTRHGIKAAKQIAALLDHFETPYVFVANKVQDKEDEEYMRSELGDELLAFIPYTKATRRGELKKEVAEVLHDLIEELQSKDLGSRKDRSANKFKRNKEFANR